MFGKALVICEKEIRSLRHNPSERLFRLIRPMLWLLLFGSVLKVSRLASNIPPGLNYQQFMLPGILVNAVLVTSMSYGITLKWESDLGILSRMLVAPVRRVSIVLGKALSCVARAFVDVTVFLLLAWIIQIRFSSNIPALLSSWVVIVVFVIGISSLGMTLAMLMKSREAYTGIVSLIATPSLFASNSLYTIDQMPGWLRIVALVNPITYTVDFIRRLLIFQTFDFAPLLLDFGIVVVFSAILLSVAVVLFQRISH